MPPKVLTDAQLRDELDLVRGEVAGLQQLLRGVRSEVRELRQLVHQGLDQSRSAALRSAYARVGDCRFRGTSYLS